MLPFCYIWTVVQQAQRLGKSGSFILLMTVFRKFEVCASYGHLWYNRHLHQAENRQAVKKPPFFIKNLQFSYFTIQVKPFD